MNASRVTSSSPPRQNPSLPRDGPHAQLLIHDASAPARRAAIDRLPFTIGRGAAADLRLADRAISESHCVIEFRDGGFRIRDLKSRNGTNINGSPVREEPLRWGDSLEIGRARLTFLSPEPSDSSCSFVPDQAPSVDEPPPALTQEIGPAGPPDFSFLPPGPLRRRLDLLIWPPALAPFFFVANNFFHTLARASKIKLDKPFKIFYFLGR